MYLPYFYPKAIASAVASPVAKSVIKLTSTRLRVPASLINISSVSASPEAIKLEQEKMFGNSFAKHCDMKTPKILQRGDNHRTDFNIDSLPDSFVVKPSNKWTSATVVSDKKLLDVFPLEGFLFSSSDHPAKYSYYVEELIKGQETNISYIMSNGKWSFTFSESCDESKAKQIFKARCI